MYLHVTHIDGSTEPIFDELLERPIFNGKMSVRIANNKPEVMFAKNTSLPESFVVSDEFDSDLPYAPYFRIWKPLRGLDTSIVIINGEERLSVRIEVLESPFDN